MRGLRYGLGDDVEIRAEGVAEEGDGDGVLVAAVPAQ